MEKEFVPYNLALELEKLSFDNQSKLVRVYEDQSGRVFNPDFAYHSQNDLDDYRHNKEKVYIQMILWQQAFDWFLKNHKLFSETTLWGDGIGYITTIKEIRQGEFLEVYDLGFSPPNKGLPNWNPLIEKRNSLVTMINIIKNR